MADERIALKQLPGKSSDTELPSEKIGFVANRLLQLDVESLCKASRYERNGEWENYRTGYRRRAWKTRAGTIDLKVPELRRGSYFPEFLEPRRASERALVAVIQEAYIGGLSTRDVDKQVKTMGVSGVSKRHVPRLCASIRHSCPMAPVGRCA